MFIDLGSRFQTDLENRFENVPTKVGAPLREGAVADGYAGQLTHVLGQRTRSAHDMEDHPHEQLVGTQLEGSSLARTPLPQESADKGDTQQLGEEFSEKM